MTSSFGRAGASRHPIQESKKTSIGSCLRNRRRKRCTATNVDPSFMQQLIVGGAVTAAVGSALYNGLKKDQVTMCDLCRGVGAVQTL